MGDILFGYPKLIFNQTHQPGMEEWKEIPGYEGIYRVSNLGRVSNGKNILVPNLTSGKPRVCLYKFKEQKRFTIESLVAAAFPIIISSSTIQNDLVPTHAIR